MRDDTQRAVNYDDDAHNMLNEIEDKSWWFRHRNRCIETVVRMYAKRTSDDNFVEIGAGNGCVSSYIAEQTKMSTISFEPGIQGARNCIKRGLQNVVCGFFEHKTVIAESVDNIGIFDVLEHIEDESSFLVELRAALSNVGRLFITVPAYQSLWSYADIEARHYRRYNITHLKKIVINNGFKILFATYIFALLPIPIWLLRKQSYKHIQTSNEFTPPRIISSFAETFFLPEIAAISRKCILPFGASILLVAIKA